MIFNSKKKRTAKALLWFKIIVIVYGVIGLAVYLLQEKFIFQPVTLKPDYAYTYKPISEINIPVNKKTNINIIKFLTCKKAKGVVLYFHGNKGNVNRYARLVNIFTDQGYEAWIMDYPGYGKSTGEISEKGLYEVAGLIYDLAAKQFPPSKIFIYGKSLGSGIATELASVKACKGLILETPYYSMPAVFESHLPIYPMDWLIKYRFPVYQFIQKVDEPVIIFHGTADKLIPLFSTRKLMNLLKPSDQFIIIKGGKHKGLWRYSLYQQKIDSLLRL